MSWALAVGLALAAFAAMVVAWRLPRPVWTSVLAALMLGLAGFVLQGRPGLAGAPKVQTTDAAGDSEAMVDLRRAILPERFHSRNRRLITADAMARRDRPEEAATLLRGAIRDNPRDAESWLALANALVAAADGAMTPASQYAYRRAEELAPESPGVPFFVGIFQLEQGNLLDARMLWDEALRRAPEGSEERADIAAHVERLDDVLRRILAEREGQGAGPPAE